MAVQSSLPAKLKRSASVYAGHLTRMVKTNAPKHLQDNIKTIVKETSPGIVRVTVQVTAPDARAQEYGSGLHKDGRMGAKAKYPIVGKPWLAFMPTNGFKGNAYGAYNPVTRAGVGDKTVLIKHKVMHPGIKKYKGRGYVRPAVREWVKGIKNSDINKAVKEALLGDIKKAFMTGWKK